MQDPALCRSVLPVYCAVAEGRRQRQEHKAAGYGGRGIKDAGEVQPDPGESLQRQKNN